MVTFFEADISFYFNVISIKIETVNTTKFLVFTKLHVSTHVGRLQAKILCLYVFLYNI